MVPEGSPERLQTRLDTLQGALGALWDALGALFGRSWELLGAPQPFLTDLGSNFDPPEIDFGYLQGSIFDLRGSIGE